MQYKYIYKYIYIYTLCIYTVYTLSAIHIHLTWHIYSIHCIILYICQLMHKTKYNPAYHPSKHTSLSPPETPAMLHLAGETALWIPGTSDCVQVCQVCRMSFNYTWGVFNCSQIKGTLTPWPAVSPAQSFICNVSVCQERHRASALLKKQAETNWQGCVTLNPV